ncbi:NAD(P)H-dependent oxidoreductase [Mycolicibacterium vaccae]|uniref:NAD(P)H dehydrogenase (Quinone) n=1 Tax=Mycolicibacterium vaccae ATCC 25954 TaxID=1194972 RepID=K0V8E6_MYCVA|nr:NAD(P)H-dependent oxidoreductase [Mycolicibacterium vaccae]ANI41304.1 NAD(P)H dehydrogenase (quinone) [Mycolicibacterium vaccae 95051]EJZ11133.1 NAD(P)H dehydrogenase (quinone) [Mycolicibacterium vaccae ATCC 25954]
MSEPDRRHALLVTALPNPESVTGEMVRALAAGLSADGQTKVTVHDLISTGFNPVFGPADHQRYRSSGSDGKVAVPDDVQAEQKLIESADTVVLAFPVQWWSMPAVLKGWIDRVFIRGWAYGVADQGECPVRGLHFVAMAAFGQEPFERRGYRQAMEKQWLEGLADYISIADSGVHNLYESESTDPAVHAKIVHQAREIGVTIAQSPADRPATT